MIDEKPRVPLSPPNSPRMSDTAAKPSEYQWLPPQSSPFVPPAPIHLPPPPRAAASPHGSSGSAALSDGEFLRPPLRSHKSFPYSLGPSSRLQHDGTQSHEPGSGLGDFTERVTAQGPQPVGTSSLPPATFGGSAPTSPAGRVTPNSPSGALDDERMEEEEDEEGFDTAEQVDGQERPPMTAAELRAHKRKMKRFRLTHNQTRFLMSEFARQAHPDAAHRERLSREIPGLSPRQVQVWFQNRRAKLKRLTTDDRERMMRSRALPADFDMTQALHSPFGAQPPPGMGTPMLSPGPYASYGEISAVRPLTLDTLRRVPEYGEYGQHQYASPTGATPALGSFAFTPPQSATETMSPASTASAYSWQTHDSPRRFPFGISLNTHSGYGAQAPALPRTHLHDRLGRPLGETAGSPLRTSMSYTGLNSSGLPQTHSQERSYSLSEQSSLLQNRPHPPRSMTGPSTSAPGPVGLGFTYSHIPSYASSEQQPQPTSGASQSPESQYRRSSSHLAGPPISSYPQYQAPQFSTPPIPQYQAYGSQYSNQNYSNAFNQQSQHDQGSTQQNYPSLPSQPHQFVPLSGSNEREVDEGDNSTGGVSLPPSY